MPINFSDPTCHHPQIEDTEKSLRLPLAQHLNLGHLIRIGHRRCQGNRNEIELLFLLCEVPGSFPDGKCSLMIVVNKECPSQAS
jgi:hypothetical protein